MKKIINPFQRVLLKRRLCAGCTYPLDNAKVLGDITDKKRLIECKCRRRYILELELNDYRRATFEEEQLFLAGKKK